MSNLYQYDPRLVTASWGAIMFYGYANDSMIKATRNQDSSKYVPGGHGDGTRVSMTDRSGKFTIRLLAQSPCNDLVSAALIADELFGASVAPFFVKDLQGTTLIEATDTWILKPAEVDFSTDAGEREWTFECHEMLVFGGGSSR